MYPVHLLRDFDGSRMFDFSGLAAKPSAPFTMKIKGRDFVASFPFKPGRKDDNGKPRMDLLPFAALEAVAKVLSYGATKYGDDNWRDVTPFRSRYLAAALRHLAAYGRGEEKDADTGLPHLAHAACSVLFLLEGPRADKGLLQRALAGAIHDQIYGDDVVDALTPAAPTVALRQSTQEEIARDVERSVKAIVAATARESRKSRPRSQRAALPGSHSKRQSQPRR